MLFDLLIYLALSLALNIGMFFVAYKLQSDKLTDASYAVSFLVLIVAALLMSNASLYALIAAVIVSVWALRIGGFLVYRVIKVGKDSRFDEMRSDFFKFLGFWLLQGFTTWALLIPLFLAFAQGVAELSPIAVIGACIALTGIVIEAIADAQKWRFTRIASNKNKWIDSGLWRVSRHPNYFGEILVWIGVYIYVASVLNVFESIISLVSPLLITCLLLFVSGIPLLEKAADKRWGNLAEYKRYKSKTSILIPLPPKR